MSKIKKALISVSNKQNLKPLLQSLKTNKIEIISSGGTFKEIKKLKFDCTEVSEFTNSPEILEGRVKTLHPKIHAGILNKRKNKNHQKDLKRNNFENIDLVIVNFYPFEKTLNSTNDHKKIIENIDVGGPTMVRAAAKNYNDVTVITSPIQYDELIDQLDKNDASTTLEFRKKMSQIAFTETAYYDAVISDYFNKLSNTNFPKKKLFYGNLVEKLRYGENPHQESAIYSKHENLSIKQIHGKQLSYNNYNDIFAALTISKSLPLNRGTVIVKHANPCGVSIKKNNLESYQSALACDPTSAFGGIIAFNRALDAATASHILERQFVEVIIAPGVEQGVIELFEKKPSVRLLVVGALDQTPTQLDYRRVQGGLLIQETDTGSRTALELTCVTEKQPSSEQMTDLLFAWKVAKFVKSNAIIYARNKQTIGVGAGQMSRIYSARIAAIKAQDAQLEVAGSVMASDAFFPFRDGIDAAAEAGIAAVIQPGGSIRDDEVIAAANEHGIAMVFTGMRHFRH